MSLGHDALVDTAATFGLVFITVLIYILFSTFSLHDICELIIIACHTNSRCTCIRQTFT